ncbi:MAG: hypothetical protein LUG60_04495 [Erysipelotrichaceae bacterium]|nr:hypothetical protein [Erysipelotrichaceae bacterium]
MKKIMFILLCGMLCMSVSAESSIPQYQIIANSNSSDDIKEMYTIKNQLLEDYKLWSEGVDNVDQVLADHTNEYNATYNQGIYTIILGNGEGKSLTGELKVNYCSSTTDIKKKSLLFEWLGI